MSMTLEKAIRILSRDTEYEEWKSACEESGHLTTESACDEATLLACGVMQREVEREKGCDWCINGAELTTGFLSDSDITPLQGLSGSTTYALRVGTEYRKINFCPMCGKPLNDGEGGWR